MSFTPVMFICPEDRLLISSLVFLRVWSDGEGIGDAGTVLLSCDSVLEFRAERHLNVQLVALRQTGLHTYPSISTITQMFVC
jgi:hypothetical protein